jgi:hypothetical protein
MHTCACVVQRSTYPLYRDSRNNAPQFRARRDIGGLRTMDAVFPGKWSGKWEPGANNKQTNKQTNKRCVYLLSEMLELAPCTGPSACTWTLGLCYRLSSSRFGNRDGPSRKCRDNLNTHTCVTVHRAHNPSC